MVRRAAVQKGAVANPRPRKGKHSVGNGGAVVERAVCLNA